MGWFIYFLTSSHDNYYNFSSIVGDLFLRGDVIVCDKFTQNNPEAKLIQFVFASKTTLEITHCQQTINSKSIVAK